MAKKNRTPFCDIKIDIHVTLRSGGSFKVTIDEEGADDDRLNKRLIEIAGRDGARDIATAILDAVEEAKSNDTQS